MPQEHIRVSVPDTRERKKRQRELYLALAAFLLIFVLTWVELRFFGANSYLFLAVFNINLILLLLVLFLVVRNGVKLMLERRRKVLGSQIRSRLVLAFISLSLVPTVLMFVVSMKFVQTSVDYWFKSQVGTSLEHSLEVGQAFYEQQQDGVEVRGRFILDFIRDQELAWGGQTMDAFLQRKQSEYEMNLVGVLRSDLEEQNWHVDQEWREAWPEIKRSVDWEALKRTPRFWSAIRPGPSQDLVVGVLPVDDAATGFLVLGQTLGSGLLFKLDQIVHGVEEYNKLRTLKVPLTMALYLILGVMTLLILFGAMWFGFRLAKEISAPVQALAAGTQRIARGDLSVRLKDQSEDELGMLVRSFNSMAEDLQQSQERLKDANDVLAQQNRELDSRGQYMAAVLDNIAAGVISLDSRGNISTINRAAEATLGIDGGQFLGRDPLAFLYGDYAVMIRDMLEQLRKSPKAQWQRQLDLTLGSRQLKLLVNAVVLKTSPSQDAGIVVVFEDITELDKMQRMAAWQEVARRIAHEIKNPLTPIKLSAQRLQRKFSEDVTDETFGQLTGLIIRQVEHLQQMVREFSAFAKLPEVELRRNFLAPLVEEVVQLFRSSHSTIHWKLNFGSQIPAFKFDREGMKRVLINLLTNAAEVLEETTEPEVAVVVDYDPGVGWVRIEVRDNGPGFNDEERSRLFEPYYSRKQGGTGLGLSIVKSVVTDHRGYVRVKPNEPVGSVFVVELPV
ncbi:MAG: ATP-binding protein [Desulfovibrionales bacterium]